MPMCIQKRTNGCWPVAGSVWAISHSWCGKIRSLPPPWMSSCRAEVARRHGGALDVPARPARPPRAVPGRLARRLRLPEHEIERVALVRVIRAGCRARWRPAASRPAKWLSWPNSGTGRRDSRRCRWPIVGVPASISVPTIATISGMTSLVARVVVGRADVQRLHVADEVRSSSGSQLVASRRRLARLAQDVVVDVGDVLDVVHLEPLAFQVAHQDVGRQYR